jgi:hypothetical protein
MSSHLWPYLYFHSHGRWHSQNLISSWSDIDHYQRWLWSMTRQLSVTKFCRQLILGDSAWRLQLGMYQLNFIQLIYILLGEMIQGRNRWILWTANCSLLMKTVQEIPLNLRGSLVGLCTYLHSECRSGRCRLWLAHVLLQRQWNDKQEYLVTGMGGAWLVEYFINLINVLLMYCHRRQSHWNMSLIDWTVLIATYTICCITQEKRMSRHCSFHSSRV